MPLRLVYTGPEMAQDYPAPQSFEQPVVVYGTLLCGYCAMAKRLLAQREIPFGWVDVGEFPQARAFIAQASGQRTVPQIFVRGVAIGGFTELRALDASGRLEAMLTENEVSP